MLNKTQIELKVAQYRVMLLQTLLDSNEEMSDEAFEAMVADYKKKLEESNEQ